MQPLYSGGRDDTRSIEQEKEYRADLKLHADKDNESTPTNNPTTSETPETDAHLMTMNYGHCEADFTKRLEKSCTRAEIEIASLREKLDTALAENAQLHIMDAEGAAKLAALHSCLAAALALAEKTKV